MAVNADSVVVDVEARLGNFTGRVRQGEVQFDKSMDQITGSAGRAEKAVTGAMGKIENSMVKAGQRSRLLGYQIADVGSQLAAGTNPFLIIAQQAPQVANALDGTTGAAGRLATFFSGPLGAAVLAAGSVLAILAMRQDDASEGADKHTDSAKDLREAIADLDKTTRESINSTERSNQVTESQAKLQYESAIAVRNKTQALLEQAIAQEELFLQAQRGPTGVEGAAVVNQAAVDARARLKALQDQLGLNQVAIDQAERAVRQSQVPNMLARAEEATDAAAKATGEYERNLQKLKDQFTAGVLGTGEAAKRKFDEQAQALNRVKQAALDAARATKKKGDVDKEVGGSLTSGQAAAIVRGLGGRVTDTDRTREEQARLYAKYLAGTGPLAAKPGTGNHERGQAIDVAKGQGISLNKITAALRAQGVTITEALDEGRHYHVAWRNARTDADRFAAEQKREQDKATRQTNAFNAELADIDAQITAASRGRVTSYEQELAIAEEKVITERDRANQAYEAAASEGRITEAQAAILVAKNNQLATAKTMALYAAEGLRKEQVAQQVAIERQAIAVDRLQDDADEAKTGHERRDAALRILDAETQLERLKLQQVIDNSKIGSAERQIAELRLAELDRMRDSRARQIGNDPANMSPGERYVDDLQKTAGEIGEEVQGVAINALESLNDQLVEAIMNSESLGDVFDNVADQIVAALLRIAIQQLIIKPMAELLFGGGGGGGAGLMPMGGSGGNWLSGILSLFRAKGGPVSAQKPYVVGEEGPELFVPGNSGTIVPNGDMARMPGVGGGGGGLIRVEVVGGEYFDVRVRRISGDVATTTVRAAAPAIVNAASAKSLVDRSRPKL